MGKDKYEMEEKNWQDMNGWEKGWEVTQIIVGGVVLIVGWLLAKGGQGSASRRGSPGGQSGSVRTVGSGGKKSGSWSLGRHR